MILLTSVTTELPTVNAGSTTKRSVTRAGYEFKEG
jgi:hypothetical protein